MTAERKPFFRMFNLVRASRVGLRAATSQGSLVSRVTPLGVTQKRYQAAQAQRIGYKKIINLHDSNDYYTLKSSDFDTLSNLHLNFSQKMQPFFVLWNFYIYQKFRVSYKCPALLRTRSCWRSRRGSNGSTKQCHEYHLYRYARRIQGIFEYLLDFLNERTPYVTLIRDILKRSFPYDKCFRSPNKSCLELSNNSILSILYFRRF